MCIVPLVLFSVVLFSVFVSRVSFSTSTHKSKNTFLAVLRVSLTPPPPPPQKKTKCWQEALLGYTAVGIFEEWELTMRLFQATVRSPVRNWSSDEIVNPGPVSTQRGALLRWAHSSPAIRQAVAGDLLLYDLALSIFKRQTSESLGMEWSPRGSSSIA